MAETVLSHLPQLTTGLYSTIEYAKANRKPVSTVGPLAVDQGPVDIDSDECCSGGTNGSDQIRP